MGKEKIERLEYLQAINVQIQEENNPLKEKVHMLDRRMENPKNKIETSEKLMALLKKWFDECQGSLRIVTVD